MMDMSLVEVSGVAPRLSTLEEAFCLDEAVCCNNLDWFERDLLFTDGLLLEAPVEVKDCAIFGDVC